MLSPSEKQNSTVPVPAFIEGTNPVRVWLAGKNAEIAVLLHILGMHSSHLIPCFLHHLWVLAVGEQS